MAMMWNPDWNTELLQSIAQFRNGINYGQDNNGHGIKVIGVADFQSNFYVPYHQLKEINPEGVVRDDDLLEEGDLVFVRSNGNPDLVGRCLFVMNLPEPVTHSGFTIRLRFQDERVYPPFFAQIFRSPILRGEMSLLSGGTNITNLSQRILGALSIPLPPLEEQRKIAAILGTWDKAIGLVEQLIEALQARKKGLMQKLLTGEVRFAEFEGEEWDTFEFGEIFERISSANYKIQSKEYNETGKYPVVDQGQTLVISHTDSEKVFTNIPVILFGDHTREVKWIDFQFVVGADGVNLLKTSDNLDLLFGYFLVKNLQLPSLGYSRHFKLLKEEVFDVPASMDEQVKIAETLSTNDRFIRLSEEYVAYLQEQKRGLMQVLLTGQIRV